MDWKTIAPIVGAVAPMAGSILGGLIPFPGGSIIGQKLGEVIARQFGVDPAAPNAAGQLSDRIAEAGEETARAKVNAAVEQARIQVDGFVAYERAVLEAQVKNLSDVNVTMRAESDNRVKLLLAGIKEHPFFSAWRPAFAWTFIAVWAAFGMMLTAVTGREAWISPTPLTTLKEAWPIFASYFIPGAAVLGVLIPSRSYEKGEAMKAGLPMPNAKPVAPTPAPAPAAKPPVKPLADLANKPLPGRS